MVGAGTFINPLIKIVTTIAILAAVYFFFVKPVIDTTNDAFDKFVPDGFSETFDGFPTDIQDQINEAFEGNGEARATKLGNCVTKARQDTDRIQRCVDRFGG